ncbi:hypothetical protein [Chryseobacterium proteolyticum]|uniref:hypothetical protein n=1 Tax=Chryseobacterium proteolyticum TaxID=118127 RepID=UPI0039835943
MIPETSYIKLNPPAKKKQAELKIQFDQIVEDYAVSMNMKSEEILQYGQMITAHNEIKKLVVIICLIESLQRINILRENGGFPETPEFNEETIKDLLKDIKVEKSDDLEKQKSILETKINKYKNQLEKSKKSAEKEESSEPEDFDIDQQFWNVCLTLEMHVNPRLITVYEFGVMIKEAMSKAEAINKANNNGR